MPIVDLPDGREIEFPAGTSKDTMNLAVKNFLAKSSSANSRQEQPKISRGEAALSTFTNVPAVGMRAKAGIASGVAKLFGGETTKNSSLSDLYNEGLSSEKKKLESAREEYPVQSFATELASDIATGGKILKIVGATGKGLKAAVKGSAILSGAKTLGEEEDLTDLPKVAEDVGISSAIGGVTGGAFQQAGKLTGKVLTSGTNLVKRLVKSRSAEDILGSVVKPEEAGMLANKLSNTKDRVSILPDIAGDEVSGLTRLLAKTPGSKNIIDEALSSRTAQSSRRVANLINNNISSKAYFGNIDDLMKARAEVSAPLYKKAYEEGSDINYIRKANQGDKFSVANARGLAKLYSDKRVQNALGKARLDYGIDDSVGDNSVEALHGARQVIDDIIDVAKRAGEDNKVRSYAELRGNITKSLYKVSPTLREADKTWAGYSAMKNAQEQGLEFNKITSPEELKKIVKDYTPGEKDAFKIGVRENLMRIADKTVDGSSAARKIYNNPLNRDKLKIVFSNPKEYGEFARKLGDEVRIFNTKQRILGGSRTDINLKDEAEIIGKVAGGALSPKASGISGIISAVTDSLQKRYVGLNEKNAKELAKILTSKEKSIDALRNIAAKSKEKEQAQILKNSVNEIIPIIIGQQTGSGVNSALSE